MEGGKFLMVSSLSEISVDETRLQRGVTFVDCCCSLRLLSDSICIFLPRLFLLNIAVNILAH